jgi:hypothetical protein
MTEGFQEVALCLCRPFYFCLGLLWTQWLRLQRRGGGRLRRVARTPSSVGLGRVCRSSCRNVYAFDFERFLRGPDQLIQRGCSLRRRVSIRCARRGPVVTSMLQFADSEPLRRLIANELCLRFGSLEAKFSLLTNLYTYVQQM